MQKLSTEQIRFNLIKWSDSYYNSGTSLVSDLIFDSYRNKLSNRSLNGPV